MFKLLSQDGFQRGKSPSSYILWVKLKETVCHHHLTWKCYLQFLDMMWSGATLSPLTIHRQFWLVSRLNTSVYLWKTCSCQLWPCSYMAVCWCMSVKEVCMAVWTRLCQRQREWERGYKTCIVQWLHVVYLTEGIPALDGNSDVCSLNVCLTVWLSL